MEEKSDIEILKDFARSTNRKIVVKESLYPRTGFGTTQKYRRMVFIPNNSGNTSFFIWFNDPYFKIGQSTIFSGAFIPLSSRIKSRLYIRNRTILDKLSVFSKTKAGKIGSGNFDSKVVISGDIDAAAKRLLSQSSIQTQILKALDIASFTNVSINPHKIDFVPELCNTPSFSIINRHAWDTDKKTIENTFSRIEKIREILI